MKAIAPGAISAAAETFLRPDADVLPSRRRERAWDLCFAHFQEHPKPTEVMETSCLHLGYYLASWGMLRGSSFLFRETNLLHYQNIIEVIEKHDENLRGWDVPRYLDPEGFARFSSAWTDLREAFLPAGGRGLTLISKVIMGVWGSIPSFDTYFVATFKRLAETPSERGAWNSAGERALGTLHEVYEQHADEIDAVRDRYPVWNFASGEQTRLHMTRAKVLDIYGFYETWKR